ncbi:hypothetical protein L1987_69949 [Smallanthus sonchifolius]|uniref:Uncharacterized protein n=1 Tax=Smallanthus sonchifolius TaxID=185202 RepID=A0ACB9B7S4_9ASTR|nr:hypothetical protein L1987_69949 [Smallanthus sonchifolius]
MLYRIALSIIKINNNLHCYDLAMELASSIIEAITENYAEQKNYIKEETIERMRLDEEVLMNFFKKCISVNKVENKLRILGDLRDLASAKSLDAFTLVYTNILEHQPDCPPDVVEKLVGLREGIPRKDAKEVVRECKEIYENSLIDGNPPRTGFVFSKLKSLNTSKVTNILRKLR